MSPSQPSPTFPTRFRFRFWAVTLALILAACTSPQSRIERNPELFASFSPEIQDALRSGRIEPGYTPEMVRIALGPADRVYHRTLTDDTQVLWTYVHLIRESRTQPLHLSGIRGSAWVDVDTVREVPFRTVTFADGKVTVIEELQSP